MCNVKISALILIPSCSTITCPRGCSRRNSSMTSFACSKWMFCIHGSSVHCKQGAGSRNVQCHWLCQYKNLNFNFHIPTKYGFINHSGGHFSNQLMSGSETADVNASLELTSNHFFDFHLSFTLLDNYILT